MRLKKLCHLNKCTTEKLSVFPRSRDIGAGFEKFKLEFSEIKQSGVYWGILCGACPMCKNLRLKTHAYTFE